ncbi:protein pinocchio [Leptinotarsa decemlineata]|uniref:protein pinocchio n=1 Tax=Leptinotarsa decemlineata TaxID=7539 RepID=UPI000C2533BA|nr:protein pinocchio [Leptinotarsa decemlineata]
MSLASVQRPKLVVSLSTSALNLLDELIPPRYLDHKVDLAPSEEIPNEFKSCFSCGVTWYDDHVSLDCSECGGYALERPCPECDGNCGAMWERDLHKSHAYQRSYWIGKCRNRSPKKNPTEAEQKNTDASEGLSMSMDKLSVKNS